MSSSGESDGDSWNKEFITAVRKKQGKGKTILEEARLEQMKECLNRGADIDTQNEDGNTALHIAVKRIFFTIVQFLRRNGARADIPNLKGDTAITIAEKLGRQEIISLLKNSIDLQESQELVQESAPSLIIGDNSTTEIQPFLDKGTNRYIANETLNRSWPGIVYQLKHLTFTLHCALKQTNPYFLLATEMIKAGKFDDLVLQYTNSKGKRVGRFVQIKHRTDQRKVISAQELLAEGGDFSIATYFISWWEDRQNKTKQKKAFDDIECRHNILCTNIGIDIKELEKDGIYCETANEPDESFKLMNKKKTSAWFKFLAKESCNKKLYHELKVNSSDLHRLANEVAKCVHNRKDMRSEGGIFKKYHVALVEHAFDLKSKKFKDEFIRNKSLFREEFLAAFRKIAESADNDSPDGLIWKEIHAKFGKLEDERNFGTAIQLNTKTPLISSEQLPEDCINDEAASSDLHRLANLVAKCIHDYKPIRSETELIQKYHLTLVKYVFDLKLKKFHDQFIRNKSLSPNVKKFRENFLAAFSKMVRSADDDLPDGLIWKEIHAKFKKLGFRKNFGTKSETNTQSNSLEQLPEDDSYITDEEIDDFFGEFTLATNQPDTDELGEIIGLEIAADNEFNKLHADMVGSTFLTRIFDFFSHKGKTEDGMKYMSYKISKEIIEDMKNVFNSAIRSGKNSVYCDELESYNVEFEPKIEEVEKFVMAKEVDSPSQRIMQLEANCEKTFLCALRVHRKLQQIPKYKEHDRFIFIRLDTLLREPTRMNHVKTAFESSGHPNLLLVEFGSKCEVQRDEDALWKLLLSIVETNKKKRLILITPRSKDSLIQFKTKYQICREETDDKGFHFLTDESLRLLLKKSAIEFQGNKTKTSFEKLLGICDSDYVEGDKLQDLAGIIDSVTLIELIRGKNAVRIGDSINTLGEVEHYYIGRNIFRHVVIKDDFFEDQQIPDLFAISKQMGETSINLPDRKNFIILEHSKEEEQFKALCEKNVDRNVHWLRIESDKFIWQKSKGRISYLCEHRDTVGRGYDNIKDVTCVTGKKLVMHDDPVIISATAGMGKSTMLSHLASELTGQDMTVFRIDLNHHTAMDALAEVEKKKNKKMPSYHLGTIDDAIEFLVNKLLGCGTDTLEHKVFKSIIQKRRDVALIFDGFDEISPSYEDTVIDLLEVLAKNQIRKLFVATRPHVRLKLEKKLNTFSHEIQPLTQKNQEFFLTEYWRFKFNLSRDFDQRIKERIKKYAKAIMKKIARSIKDQANKFTGVALQIKLVAEIFQNQNEEEKGSFDSCEKFMRSNDEEPKFPLNIDLIYLYEESVKKKFDDNFQRGGSNPTNPAAIKLRTEEYDRFIRRHQELALVALLNENQLKELLPTREYTADFDIAEERTGIITHMVEGQPYFSHQTYAEYFAAKFFYTLVKKPRLQPSVQKIFVADILLNENYEIMRGFINCLLSDKHDIDFTGECWQQHLTQHRSKWDGTIFHVAAAEGNDQIIGLFLDCLRSNPVHQNTVINHKDILGRTAVFPAAGNGHMVALKLLVEQTAVAVDINHKDHFGTTPLFAATRLTNDLEVVKYLVDKEADVNSSCKKGSTPLYIAAQCGHLKVVKYLLDNGANVNSSSNNGVTPLYIAAQNGHLDVVKYLLKKKANVDPKSEDGVTPLCVAAAAGHLDVVVHLLDNGANVDSPMNNGATPLYMAAQNGHLDVVKYLLDNGANVNSSFNNGATALCIAAQNGHLDVVKYLLDNGDNVNSSSNNGATPLHSATASGHADVVKYLLKKKANVDPKSEDGVTPLFIAAAAGHLDVVVHLFDNKANVDSPENSGVTPLRIAAQNGHLDVVVHLLDNGANVNSSPNDGVTPLYIAAQKGHLDVVKYLLKKKANVDPKSKNGVTPLCIAAQNGHLDVVKYLLDNGANVNSSSNDGVTPLYIAAQNGHLDVVKYLLDKKANVNSSRNDGATPLHTAAQNGHSDVVKYLLDNGAHVNSSLLVLLLLSLLLISLILLFLL